MDNQPAAPNMEHASPHAPKVLCQERERRAPIARRALERRHRLGPHGKDEDGAPALPVTFVVVEWIDGTMVWYGGVVKSKMR